jgi:putative ABC transport system permease protein
LGARHDQVIRLLVWQFSKPVVFSLVVALPAAFFASNLYLNMFADRIGSPIFILLFSGVVSVAFAWVVVGGQAYKAVRANPVDALRYE